MNKLKKRKLIDWKNLPVVLSDKRMPGESIFHASRMPPAEITDIK